MSYARKFLHNYTMPNRPIKKIFVHCSASDRLHHNDVAVIREWHLARGWDDVGYHFFINRRGVIQEGRSLHKIPAAQKGHNAKSIAICLHGNDYFLDAQLASFNALCHAMHEAHGERAITFHGHCEVSAKTCPNFDYREELNLTKRGYMR
jgi:N-acetylmuramoyl-L-alanine amidase